MYYYKILTKEEYEKIENPYTGSLLDKSDGFIHLSTQAQVPGTANRFYSNYPMVYLMIVPDNGQIVMEPGIANGQTESELYPHLYGTLDITTCTIQEYHRNTVYEAINVPTS